MLSIQKNAFLRFHGLAPFFSDVAEVPGMVFLQPALFTVELVPGKCRYLFGVFGPNDNDPVRIADDNIAGKHHLATAANRNVDLTRSVFPRSLRCYASGVYRSEEHTSELQSRI